MQPLTTLAEFAAALPPKGRVMALDVGEKTIGIALSDATRMIASPDFTIQRRKWRDDAEALAETIATHAVCGIVIGYPVNMDGSLGPRAQSMRGFARRLQEALSSSPLAGGKEGGNIPMLLWDERMSTMAVNRMMIEGDLSRARRAELVDKLAAGYILQGVLDGLK